MKIYQPSASLQKLAPRAILLLSVLTLGISVHLFMEGVEIGRPNLLLASLLSLLVLCTEYTQLTGKLIFFNNRICPKFNQLAGYIPYAFGFYLMAVEGFWSLNSLLDGFSVTVIALSIFYIACGNAVVSAGYQCTLLAVPEKT
ncbi:MAG: hypothetical protein ACR2PT_16620 [Endozoicomonas sp.]